jgi:hypothetical protein
MYRAPTFFFGGFLQQISVSSAARTPFQQGNWPFCSTEQKGQFFSPALKSLGVKIVWMIRSAQLRVA